MKCTVFTKECQNLSLVISTWKTFFLFNTHSEHLCTAPSLFSFFFKVQLYFDFCISVISLKSKWEISRNNANITLNISCLLVWVGSAEGTATINGSICLYGFTLTFMTTSRPIDLKLDRCVAEEWVLSNTPVLTEKSFEWAVLEKNSDVTLDKVLSLFQGSGNKLIYNFPAAVEGNEILKVN